MNDLTSFAVLTTLTVGVVQVIKIAKLLPTELLPLASLIVGILLTGVAGFLSISPLTILMGIAVGLSAAGLYDQKKIIK